MTPCSSRNLRVFASMECCTRHGDRWICGCSNVASSRDIVLSSREGKEGSRENSNSHAVENYRGRVERITELVSNGRHLYEIKLLFMGHEAFLTFNVTREYVSIVYDVISITRYKGNLDSLDKCVWVVRRRRRLAKICEVKRSILHRYAKFGDSDCVNVFNFISFLTYKIEIRIKRWKRD